jgi:hypothetical protein
VKWPEFHRNGWQIDPTIGHLGRQSSAEYHRHDIEKYLGVIGLRSFWLIVAHEGAKMRRKRAAGTGSAE